ncbi:MAG: LPS export ABC transporter periplasmic protein LptC [Thermodesulfobacteriota bacterium]
MPVRKTKIILTALILIVAGVLVTVFVAYRKVLDKVDTSFLPENTGAILSIKRLRQTATRNGIKEWSLDAGSAQFVDGKKLAVLKDLSVTFYPKEGLPIFVTADQGLLKIDSNDIEASGNVVVKREGYRLDTDSIQYEHSRRMIHAPRPVKITAEAFDLAADAMSFELDTKKTRFKGNVRGTIREQISM